ncbi:hypothetical protein IJI69_04795 [Candidatus Saccharibacteria bacterium]|nr:hypothetical protein [Candidatus Saccharibacteria bacterium]
MGGIKKKDLRTALRKLSKIKTWQLLIIFVLLLFIEATLLRFDHIEMTNLKADVVAADEAGDDDAINEALLKLQTFARTHTVINVVEKNGESYVTFGTGPVYLENQYQRKASAALAEAEAKAGTDENPNGNVFAKAMDVCKPLAITYGWAWNSQGYLECMTGEINKYPASERIEDTYVASLPSTALFRFDFASPIWTPTLSGFVGIICLIFAAVLIIRAFSWLFLRLALVFIKN